MFVHDPPFEKNFPEPPPPESVLPLITNRLQSGPNRFCRAKGKTVVNRQKKIILALLLAASTTTVAFSDEQLANKGEDGAKTATTTPKPEGKMATDDYRSIAFKTIHGHDSTLADFTGKVVLLVNVASKCGNTPQYEGLEALYEKYKDKGLVVIGFPANNFGGQEPGSNEDILKFCTTEYKVSFPMMAKISVKGEDKHPLYQYLTEKSPFPGDIQWNFGKFLLDREGKVVARFAPKTQPESEEVVKAIEGALKSKG
jgi:glutathione peroxidase